MAVMRKSTLMTVQTGLTKTSAACLRMSSQSQGATAVREEIGFQTCSIFFLRWRKRLVEEYLGWRRWGRGARGQRGSETM